jgi:hypothetical protein
MGPESLYPCGRFGSGTLPWGNPHFGLGPPLRALCASRCSWYPLRLGVVPLLAPGKEGSKSDGGGDIFSV